MKICYKCQLIKSEFRKKIKNKDGLDNFCKDCRKEDDKRSYNKNIISNRISSLILKNKARNRNRQFICDYLVNKSCIDCGEKDPIVLEFDHIENKFDNLSNLILNCSLERLVKEIKKCEIRCANCHRRKSSLNLGYYKTKIVG